MLYQSGSNGSRDFTKVEHYYCRHKVSECTPLIGIAVFVRVLRIDHRLFSSLASERHLSYETTHVKIGDRISFRDDHPFPWQHRQLR